MRSYNLTIENLIRERCAKTRTMAQVSRSEAFTAIPFLLNELDAIDHLLSRRNAIDGIPDRYKKIEFLLHVLQKADPSGAMAKVSTRHAQLSVPVPPQDGKCHPPLSGGGYGTFAVHTPDDQGVCVYCDETVEPAAKVETDNAVEDLVELKCCPFCGLTATAMRNPSRWWVECDGCGVSTPADNFGDPVDCWNTRTKDAAIEALADAAKRLGSGDYITCPNCPDQGWYAEGPTDDPEQVQCEFCCVETRSLFNLKESARAALNLYDEMKGGGK